MGFKVDIKELTDYKNDIKRNSSAVKSQIENAIQSMHGSFRNYFKQSYSLLDRLKK
jgi:hypothetical protein